MCDLNQTPCHKCGCKPSFKTDGESKPWCHNCLDETEKLEPINLINKPKIGRNNLCRCGSGIKNKKCCKELRITKCKAKKLEFEKGLK